MIDAENTKNLKKLWIMLAAYYQFQISDEQVMMYVEDCSEHQAELIYKAMKAWRSNPRNNRMPLPGQILSLIATNDDTPDANLLVTKLITAVIRHDYTWPLRLNKQSYKTGTFEGDFIDELGPIAQHAVHQFGGWGMFCERFWSCRSNETAFRAQLRDSIESIIHRKLVEKISLPPIDEKIVTITLNKK